MDKIDRKDRLEEGKDFKQKGLPLADKRLGMDRPDRGGDQPGFQHLTGTTQGRVRTDCSESKGRVDKKRYKVDRMDRVAGLASLFI